MPEDAACIALSFLGGGIYCYTHRATPQSTHCPERAELNTENGNAVAFCSLFFIFF